MLDPDLVRTRCQEITDSVARLREIAALPLASFLQDQDIQDIACYRLLRAIEAALGLCYHVAARTLGQVPEEYAQCFTLLEEAGIVPGVLADRLRRMARFRNLLVHMYWKIDYPVVHAILQEGLDDLESFARAVTVRL